MTYQEDVDRAVAQLKALTQSEELPELAPVTGRSADHSAEITVSQDGHVEVSLGQMSRETAQFVVAEAVTDLLRHFERTDLPGGVELPDFEGQLKGLTGLMSERMEEMRARMDELQQRARFR